jgi:hypothetical protein
MIEEHMKHLICHAALLVAIVGPELPIRVATCQEIAPIKELTAREVLDKVRQTLAAYSSIEYQFRVERVGPGRQSNVTKFIESGEFAYADSKFCSEFVTDSDDYKGHGYEAFDGNIYQSMRDDLTKLRVHGEIVSQSPYGAGQPIMSPFANLLANPAQTNRVDLETYRDSSVWSPVQEKATLAEPRQVDGHPCTVVNIERMSRRQQPSRFELCAALDLDYYPILVNWHIDGSRPGQYTIKVTEFVDLKTAKGRAIVPLRVESKTQDATNTYQSNQIATIDKTTLKVNEPIPSERFDLRRLMPTSITFYSDVTAEQRARFENGPK